MIYLFFTMFFLILYVYIGYPLLLLLVVSLVRKKGNKQLHVPSVSLIIAAYNEASVIKKKLENALALDYPSDKLEILVFSDGSTDGTDTIVKKYADKGVKLFRYEGRRGKTYCQNQTVQQATGNVLVFSDANSMYDKDAIKELVANFYDPAVGVVCGELQYIHNHKSREGIYWKIEKWLKKKESQISSCLGANGAIYAVRNELYEQLPDDILSDFIEPMTVIKKGYRVIYEEKAICTEEVGEMKDEFRRKRRIILRAFQSLYYVRELLNPISYGFFAIQFWSHKMLRWLVPVWIIGLFISNIFLLNLAVFKTFFVLHLLFYVLAIFGKRNKHALFSIPYYFSIINAASLFALFDFIKRKRKITWDVAR